MKHPIQFLEVLVIIITTVGFNLGRIFPHLEVVAIIIACISLLTWGVIVLTSEEQFDFTRFSFTLILIRVITPVAAFLMTVTFYAFFYKPPQTKTLEIPARIVGTTECGGIRYGTFTHFNDTIVRLKLGDQDVEVRNRIDTFNVAWIDSCYYRVSKPNHLLEFYRIIDINDKRISLEKIKNDFRREQVSYSKLE